jgi:hypothetical protein
VTARLEHGGVVWLEPAEPASDAAIAAIERAVGVALPTDYVQLLRAVNGAKLPYKLRLSGAGDEAVFEEWFRAGEPGDDSAGTVLNGVQLLEEAYFRGRLPERFVPIARTGGEDDTLLIDLSPESYGTVRAWISGTSPSWGLTMEDTLHEVAPNLAAFFQLLELDEELAEEF